MKLINLFFYIFVISFLFLGNDIELNVYNNASISPEIIFSIILLLYISLSGIKRNLNFPNSYHLYFISISFILILIFIKDFIFYGFRSLYGINFVLLLLSIFIFQKFVNEYNYNKIKIILFFFILYITYKFIFNPQIIEDYDYLDTNEGRVYRLKFFGFESNTIAIILNCLIIYIYSLILINFKNKNFFNFVFSFILLFLMLYFLFITFSRASYISLFICFFYLIGFRKSIILFVPICSYVLFYLYKINFINEYIIDRIFEISTFSNPRIEMWIDGINYFKNGNILNYLWGIGFNKFALDNTILNIFLSTGFIGFIIFILFFYNLYKLITYNYKSKYIDAIFINLLFTSFFIDLFAQRKIIYIAFLIIFLLIKRKNKIEHSNF